MLHLPHHKDGEQMIKFFMATVQDVLADHVITFNVDTIAPDLQPPPEAVPAMKLTRYPQPKDEVFIVQPDSDFEIFLYWITPDEGWDISLNYGNAFIRVTDVNYDPDADDPDANPDYQILMNTSNGASVTMSKDTIALHKDDGSDITLNGDSIQVKQNSKEVTLTGNNITINSGMGTITANGAVAPATTGMGPFCAIPNCLFTGMPHGGNRFSGTGFTMGS